VAAIEVRRNVPTSIASVWATVTDFGAYGRWIPLTSMRVDDPPVRLGWGFAGKTGLGPLGFLDTMLIIRWEPPADGRGRFAIRKTGRVLRGWADVELHSTGGGDAGTDIVWREEIVPRPEAVGRRLAVVLDPITERLFATALDGMLEDAARRSLAG
jgi:uncharacterized protein YndB with AHSA1/START domain